MLRKIAWLMLACIAIAIVGGCKGADTTNGGGDDQSGMQNEKPETPAGGDSGATPSEQPGAGDSGTGDSGTSDSGTSTTPPAGGDAAKTPSEGGASGAPSGGDGN